MIDFDLVPLLVIAFAVVVVGAMLLAPSIDDDNDPDDTGY